MPELKNKEELKEFLIKKLESKPEYLKDLLKELKNLKNLKDSIKKLKRRGNSLSNEEIQSTIEEAGKKKREIDRNKKNTKWDWQDQGRLNDKTASELREKARALALKGKESGPYGMATTDGIKELSELLNDVLKYSSGHFRKNKPIAELIRNFNSMKSLESHIVGNEDSLKIVADKEDLEEVTQTAKDPNATRKAKLSMQRTYADKIRALNKFDYSEKLEIMLRNALYDIYNNNKIKVKSDSKDGYKEILENQKAINTGKILLPLLRTKNEPKYYNYDFQYDVLKEIIRQEEFYNKYNSRYGPPDEGNINDTKVDSTAAKFVLLRYLMTILNTAGSNTPADPTFDIELIDKECFNSNITKSLSNIVNGDDISDGLKNSGNIPYEKYLATFKKYLESNVEAEKLVGKINKSIAVLYPRVKANLKDPKKKNNTNIDDLGKSLKMLANNMKNENEKRVIRNLTTKLFSIYKSISGTSINYSAIVELCGQIPIAIQAIMDSRDKQED